MLLFPTGTKAELERKPYVVYGILVAFVTVQPLFSLVSLIDTDLHLWLLRTFGFVPAESNLWALITSLFIHMGWVHLAGNALYLWLFGAGLENRMGHTAFAILYLTAGICSGLIHGTGVDPLAYGTPLIGASGAVAGVLGAYLVLMPFTDIRFSGCFLVWPVSFHVAAIWFLPFWFLLQFIQAQWGGGGAGEHIAYWAHVGGFLIGVPVGVLVRTSDTSKKAGRPEKRKEPEVNVAALVLKEKQQQLRGRLFDGDFQAAWAAYTKLQQEFPGTLLESDSQLLLGEQAVREGEYRRALEAYRDLANSNRPDEVRARAAYRMGMIYLERLADRERAARVLQILVSRFPDTDAARGAEERLREIFPQG